MIDELSEMQTSAQKAFGTAFVRFLAQQDLSRLIVLEHTSEAPHFLVLNMRGLSVKLLFRKTRFKLFRHLQVVHSTLPAATPLASCLANALYQRDIPPSAVPVKFMVCLAMFFLKVRKVPPA